MLSIEEIRRKLSAGQYRLDPAASSAARAGRITPQSIREAGENAELIDEDARNRPASECLLLGFANDGFPLHMQVSRLDGAEVRIVTLYVPDPDEWYDYRVRRSNP